jgi:hypothetical protein
MRGEPLSATVTLFVRAIFLNVYVNIYACFLSSIQGKQNLSVSQDSIGRIHQNIETKPAWPFVSSSAVGGLINSVRKSNQLGDAKRPTRRFRSKSCAKIIELVVAQARVGCFAHCQQR